MDDSKNKECTVQFEPSGLKVNVPSGTTLLEAARRAGIYLSSICGGDGYCGKCKVIINKGQSQSRPSPLLTPEEIRDSIVLACQTKVLSDLTVTVPKSHSLETSQVLMDADAHILSRSNEQTQEGLFEYDPLVRKLCVEMSPPTVLDHTADHERLYAAIRRQIDAPIMQTGFRRTQHQVWYAGRSGCHRKP